MVEIKKPGDGENVILPAGDNRPINAKGGDINITGGPPGSPPLIFGGGLTLKAGDGGSVTFVTEGSPNPPSGEAEDGPPEDILVELTKQQRKILAFVWQHPTTTTRDLQEQVWEPKVVEPASILRSLERLQEKLLDLGYTEYMIELPGDDYVVFKRSDK